MGVPLEVTINIRNLAFGGAGVGEVVEQSDGKEDLLGITAFVPFTAVGEQVTAQIVQHKKRYIHAQLNQVINASAERVQPPCPYFMNCGGCELQHISYTGQLKAKQEMIEGALRAARLSSKVLDVVKPIVPGTPYNYRRRITLHLDAGGQVGFYRQNSRAVVPISSCKIAVPEMQEALERVGDFGRAVAGKISSLLLEADAKGLVAVLKSPYDLTKTEQAEILKTARTFFSNVSLTVGGREVGGFGRQILELPLNESGSTTFHVPAGSFSQVNWGINLKLIRRVTELARPEFAEPIYDLYAGAGNFTLPLARAGAKVTAVETDPRLVSFARDTAKRHKLEQRITYLEESVEKFLARNKKTASAKTVIADPPRSGLGPLVAQLQFPQTVLLIGCHLASFVRDIRAFADLGWSVETIEPFDMFAQTSYVEVLGVLRRA